MPISCRPFAVLQICVIAAGRYRFPVRPERAHKDAVPVMVDNLFARVAELVDARDLKSLEVDLRVGSTPTPGTKKMKLPAARRYALISQLSGATTPQLPVAG